MSQNQALSDGWSPGLAPCKPPGILKKYSNYIDFWQNVRDELSLENEPSDDHLGVKTLVTTLPVDHAGTTVYLKGWCVPGSTRRAVILVHDLGEHTDLYRETAHAFVRAGHSCYCFDLRGHGRSGRRLGHAPSYNILIHDLLQVTAWVRHLEAGRSPILLGQGIGALVVIDFTKSHGNFCDGAVLSAPCMDLARSVNFFKHTMIKLLAETWPTFRIPAALSPRFARELRQEREVHTKTHNQIATFPELSAVFTAELLGAIRRAEAKFIEYHGKVLILCPQRDSICTYEKIHKSAAIHRQDNFEIIDLPGAGHNVLIDPETRDQAVEKILPWMNRIERGLSSSSEETPSRVVGASRIGNTNEQKMQINLEISDAAKL